ncbi:MAG: flagellar basal body-associated FliL family protein [Deltaproteobacteria bacterium]|nr:flagellar basal body-associated FliL family protein [Deltaproteobacteria bacterium]
MAEEEAKKKKDDATTPQAKPPKGKLKLIIIGAAALTVLGGGFFVWKKMSAGKAVEETVAEETAAAKESKHGTEAEGKKEEKVDHKKGEKEAPSAALTMDPFVVNLQDATGTRYLRVSIDLEIDGPAQDEAKAKTSQIRDSIIILLSSKGYSDVGTVQGKYQLRDEIAARVSQILAKGKVKAVYFTEFVIQ